MADIRAQENCNGSMPLGETAASAAPWMGLAVGRVDSAKALDVAPADADAAGNLVGRYFTLVDEHE